MVELLQIIDTIAQFVGLCVSLSRKSFLHLFLSFAVNSKRYVFLVFTRLSILTNLLYIMTSN